MGPDTTYFIADGLGPIRQGEILTGVLQYLVVVDPDKQTSVTVQPKRHPVALVLTQDCDLAQDFPARSSAIPLEARALIPNVLLCEADTADNVRATAKVNSEMWRRIVRNNEDRYQYLRTVPRERDALASGVEALVLDFKRVFTVPTDSLYQQLRGGANRRTALASPFLEHACCRYANYLSRVALPKDHHQE